MFTKTIHFEYNKGERRGEIVQTYTISFNRFATKRIRKYTRAIDPSKKVYVVVNRLGKVISFGVKDVFMPNL